MRATHRLSPNAILRRLRMVRERHAAALRNHAARARACLTKFAGRTKPASGTIKRTRLLHDPQCSGKPDATTESAASRARGGEVGQLCRARHRSWTQGSRAPRVDQHENSRALHACNRGTGRRRDGSARSGSVSHRDADAKRRPTKRSTASAPGQGFTRRNNSPSASGRSAPCPSFRQMRIDVRMRCNVLR